MSQQKFDPINPTCPHMLHGGDYNPDQWIDTPEVWDEDMRLMKLAHCNALSVGIFAWAALEPEEGRFEFDWLDTILDKLRDASGFAVLATPSAARPAWMSKKYPEVLMAQHDGIRNSHGVRHNFCLTSPVYRQKVRIINRKLAERYKDHPALLVWHISNEYGGNPQWGCYCELCKAAFRDWLRERYDNDIEQLNFRWWNRFWAHQYNDFGQIDPPAPSSRGENRVPALEIDWRRFVTDQTVDFYLNEIIPLRELTPRVPITTNMMGTFPKLNYWKFAPHVDVISWDNYPEWHSPRHLRIASDNAFLQDLNRSMKRKPFMLMESVPSTTNWMDSAKLKRPGMHILSAVQAVAHGSDTVQYFQYRKSRGSCEKFHGAVVDHVGHENTRVFRDVAEVGQMLEKLDDVVGTTTPAEVALIYDWENRWALEAMEGLGKRQKASYLETVQDHYRPFWKQGIAVDVIESLCDVSHYKLLVAPLLYMLRPGVAERLETFVADGGTLAATYFTGIVDENDLCFLGGTPGAGLREVFGVWEEEIDGLWPEDRNEVLPAEGNPLGLSGSYEARDLCALLHAEGADVLATFGRDFYAGRPALTCRTHGQGQAYYVASRNDERFLDAFYTALACRLDLPRALAADLPDGTTAQVRTDGLRRFLFLMNFNDEPRTIQLPEGQSYTDMQTDRTVTGPVEMESFDSRVLRTGP